MDAVQEIAGDRRMMGIREQAAVGVLVFAAACITVGILWDTSWHLTIGRDTFWTPAHLMIYLGGTLGGLVAAVLGWRATWGQGTPGVTILGLRAPLAAWGGAAMLTSAPLDDWWHNAYGLDVRILSPPHALLAAGMYGGGNGVRSVILTTVTPGPRSREKPIS